MVGPGPELKLRKACALYLNYFKPKEDEFKIMEKSEQKVVFKRKDYVNAIAYACAVLGLDVIEVNNKSLCKSNEPHV